MLTKTSPLGTEGYTYDNLNRVTEQKLDNVVYATLTYDQYSRVQSVTYPQATNGTGTLSMTGLTRDALLRATGSSFTFADGQTFSQNASLSVSGITTSQTHTFAGTTATNSYGYDSAGRLTSATVDQNQYSYSYAAPTTCSGTYNSNSGKNSNRTATTVNGVTTANCYNFADQLVSSADVQIGTPTYDDHCNTAALAGGGTPITFTYDAGDQNTAIAQGGNKVEYVKSASGTVLRKKEYENNTLVRSYRYVADGKVMQTCSLADDNACTTVDKYLSLAGNVLLTLTTAQSQTTPVYSLLNNHGDTAMTAGATGTPTSSVFLYEPFGQTSQSTTFATASNPQNATNVTMGWAASPARKAEALFSLNIVQMGARVYLPSQGRFLQTDPVEGGTPNSYVYAADPVNGSDYSGRLVIPAIYLLITLAAAAVTYYMATNPSMQKASGELLASARNSLRNLVRQGYSKVPATSPKSPNPCQPKPSPGPNKETVRIAPDQNKYEEQAIRSVEYELKQGNGPVGRQIMEPRVMKDARWIATGEGKYGASFTDPDGNSFQIHYMYNEDTCTYSDIKVGSRSKK